MRPATDDEMVVYDDADRLRGLDDLRREGQIGA
jgi:hypothetical protein